MKNQKTINQHEEQYYHIPKGRLRYIFFSLILIGLCILFYQVTISSWNFLELGSLECSEDLCSYNPYQLLILPLLILDYILLALTLCSLVSIFRKLNDSSGGGLIVGLVYGFISGLIVGLVYGFISGLFFGLIMELVVGFVYGLIIGAILGLIGGLIAEFF